MVNFFHLSESSNRRQKLLELRILIDRAQHTKIRCPLECFLFCTSFPIYIQSILDLSLFIKNELYKDYLFICSTSSIQIRINQQNELDNIDLIENFSLFIECLNLLQQMDNHSYLRLYQETIDKIHLNSNIQCYQRLLKIFYFYYLIQKSKIQDVSKSNEENNSKKTIIIE